MFTINSIIAINIFSFCQDFPVNSVEAELLDSKVHRDRGVIRDFLDLKAGLDQVVLLALRDHQEIEVLLDQQDHPASLELMDNLDQEDHLVPMDYQVHVEDQGQ